MNIKIEHTTFTAGAGRASPSSPSSRGPARSAVKPLTLRLLLAATALALLAAGCSKPATSLTAPGPAGAGLAPLLGHPAGRVVPGSYIVVLKSTTTADVDAVVDDLSSRHGFAPSFRYHNALRGFAGSMSPVALRFVRSDPRVAYVEEDQLVSVDLTQTGMSWSLDRIDQTDMPLSASYTYAHTGLGVDAYVIDTGIRLTHLQFGGRAVTGFDAVTPGGTAEDQNGHGTHVAGVLGGSSYGVAKDVRLIAVRVLDSGASGTVTGVIAGIDWVTGDHTTTPAVANLSLGGALSPTLDAAVRNSIADGIVYCIAAGNSGVDASAQSPADVTEGITVAASGYGDGFSSFSNFGPLVDLIAPGEYITSAWLTSDSASNTVSGTSMATPQVAGAAALYLEVNPAATPAEVARALVFAATPNRITSVPAGTANLLLFTQ